MITVYYENHLGEIIDLMKKPYRLITGTLFDYEWEETSSTISSFSRSAKKKNLKMDIFDDKKTYHKNIDYLNEVFEKDILAKVPGKLYFCGSYINCYIITSEKSNWESNIFMVLNLTILTDAVWIRENNYNFYTYENTSTNNKQYPYKYPYRYANGLNNAYVINPHFVDANFKMIIYGPAINPMVVVGGNSYLVNIVLEENERLEIDSRSGTILKIMSKGETVNAFHNREKKRTFFQKIKPGRQSISWTGDFAFDLVIYEERSEPKWSS